MNPHGHILLILQDPVLRRTLEGHLTEAGFGVSAATCPAAGLDLAKGVDCVLLDEGAAEGGHSRLPRPLILITGQAPRHPPAGVDGVVTRPLRLAGLVAKIKGIIAGRPRPARIGPWRFDARARMLEDETGRRVRLTVKEAAILAYLLAHAGPVGRDRLLAEIWGYSATADTHTLETHVYRLRRKIEPDPAHAALLLTEEGGYRLAG